MTAKKTERYECDDCGIEHECKNDAQLCCNEPLYACQNCERTYDERYEAEECCKNYTTIDRYCCDQCGDIYGTAQEADTCICLVEN